MADSLVLTGVKDVKKHTGTEMLLTRPKRGGDTHALKEWWKAGASKCYAECTVFNVTTAAGTVKLAIDSNMNTNLRIDHDGAFNFTFYGSNEVKRAALFTDAYELIEHYVFPAISGGKVMTVTLPGAASRPSGPPPADTTIDNVSIGLTSGDASPTVGDTNTYTATVAGDATPFTYSWSAVGGTVANASANPVSVEWTADGAGSVSVTVGSSNADFDGDTANASDTLSVTVNTVFAVNLASANVTYVVTQSGGAYYIDGVEQDAVTATAGQTIHFDLSDASLSGHPFKIYTDSTKTTEVTVGVSQEGTDLLFTPPIAGSFSYQCTQHANMGGEIIVSAATN